MADLPQLVLVILAIIAYRTEGGCCGRHPIRGTGPLAKMVTSFTQTDHLGSPTEDLRYVLIITRHGMVVPVNQENTYPGDTEYKTKWTKGRFTTHGKRLITKLGRSLATRYKSYMEAVSIQNIKVTTLNTDYGGENAKELLKGLFPDQTHPNIFRTLADKFFLLKTPNECPAYAKIKSEALTNLYIETEVRELLHFLKKNVGQDVDWDYLWNFNLYDQIYNLWEIMDFELLSKQPLPLWCDSTRYSKIQRFALVYIQTCIQKDDRTAKFIVGMLFGQILKEIRGNQLKMHIHVTNDFTYTAIKLLLFDGTMAIPEFGETLMVEVDTSFVMRVYTYRPDLEKDNFKQNEFDVGGDCKALLILENILLHTYGISDGLNEEKWAEMCNAS